MTMLRRLYEKTGSVGHLFFHYCLVPFALMVLSMILHFKVWDALPVVTTWQALLTVVAVKVSDTEYRLKKIAKNLKGTK